MCCVVCVVCCVLCVVSGGLGVCIVFCIVEHCVFYDMCVVCCVLRDVIVCN